jgi:hypothetical protein
MCRFIFALTLCASLQLAHGASTVIYRTGFETNEGYNYNFELIGQRGWTGAGTGGNGITRDSNQQAYLGLFPPTSDSETSSSVWKPIDLAPPPSGSIVKFSVDLAITDSLTSPFHRDEFRWSVYNSIGDRLFSVGFDNGTLEIFYSLSDDSAFNTGFTFRNNDFYNLVILLDFAHNRWNASLGGIDLEVNEAIAVGPLPLNLGDADAVWVYHDPTAPGDNQMIFDNYSVVIESSAPPSLQVISAANGNLRFRVLGENGAKYVVDRSTALTTNSWVPFVTNTVTAGHFDVTNAIPPAPSQRFFRARWLP